jgi:hypothetical protein
MSDGTCGHRGILGRPGGAGGFLHFKIGDMRMQRNSAASFSDVCLGPA